ncbi:hypothetical protein JKP88DRAFT_284500 [Tribonema minus]|uniref:Uncharacterized protein n=1 Tax=Tribonema minus TaxID=303371 RepID=A0A835ZEF8_9STRA|nr:hypothetical protein JKP88DRAFT_284500 [Tribonema minus]
MLSTTPYGNLNGGSGAAAAAAAAAARFSLRGDGNQAPALTAPACLRRGPSRRRRRRGVAGVADARRRGEGVVALLGWLADEALRRSDAGTLQLCCAEDEVDGEAAAAALSGGDDDVADEAPGGDGADLQGGGTEGDEPNDLESRHSVHTGPPTSMLVGTVEPMDRQLEEQRRAARAAAAAPGGNWAAHLDEVHRCVAAYAAAGAAEGVTAAAAAAAAPAAAGSATAAAAAPPPPLPELQAVAAPAARDRASVRGGERSLNAFHGGAAAGGEYREVRDAVRAAAARAAAAAESARALAAAAAEAEEDAVAAAAAVAHAGEAAAGVGALRAVKDAIVVLREDVKRLDLNGAGLGVAAAAPAARDAAGGGGGGGGVPAAQRRRRRRRCR